MTVTLTGTNGLGQSVSLTATTGADGSYTFSGMRAGTYSITETAPGGYSFAVANLGTVNGSADGTAASTTQFTGIATTSGQAGSNYNFGQSKAVTLSGVVYHDVNGDNLYDSGDTALSGVTVTLSPSTMQYCPLFECFISQP